MIIKKIKIQNYRSCLDLTFDLHPNLSVIIGPNGSGKTNILKAFLLLKKLAEEDVRRHYFKETSEEFTGQSNLKVWFEFKEKKLFFDSEIQMFSDENNDDIIVSSKQKWKLPDFTGNSKSLKLPIDVCRTLFLMNQANNNKSKNIDEAPFFFYSTRKISSQSLNIPEVVQEPFEMIGQFTENLRYYSASQFTNPAKCPVSFEIEKEGRKSRGVRLSGHAKFLFDLYSQFKSNNSSYTQFIDVVGKGGIGLINKIDFKEIPTSSVDYSVKSGGKVQTRKREKILVIPQFSIGKHELSPNQLSEGTFKTITLLFHLITDSSSLLMVEEPEVCVHHGLLLSIIELIKSCSSEKQIIISTHSDFVLDQVSPENVYKISNIENVGTTITHVPKSMSKKDFNVLKEYLKNEGNLGEYWKHGAL